ncbi:MAG: flagellar M-ring protein FliF [Hyphomicrobiaceae bacterium]|nr:MAG: flagellar M-ring protein FliF [Hyphomicrobiaceae bacterium]
MIGREQLERLWASLLGLGARRLIALGAIGLVVFAAVGLGSYYLSRPELETLYSGLSSQDASRIGAALKEAGITFDINSQGTAVFVRRGQTVQARMLLAEKGLPSSANAGYELFDKLGSMGLTSFMQEVTRVRALEGEIARTIQAMKGVRAARVHIVLPETGSFRRARQPPSASVIVRTEPAGDFAIAPAIRHLVSAAVPGMTVDQVTVLNTDGTVLASGGETSTAVPGRTVSLEKMIGKEIQDNVSKTLAPVLGLTNFEVSVAARLNTDKRQTSETSFNPESRVERSVRVVRESGSSQNTNNRAVVGVEQNVPADQAAAPAGDQTRKSNDRREELTNYEVSSKTISTVSEGYRIESLNVAVLLNRKRLLASLGDGAGPDAIDKQIKEVERLVASAAGIDANRGDRITVAALDFSQNGSLMDPVPSPGIVELLLGHTGSLLKAVTILGVAALLVWFGIRPALKMALANPPPPQPLTQELKADSPSTQPGAQGVKIAGASQPNLISDLTSKLDRSPQKRLEQMIDLDEEQAAAILKQWVRGTQRA